MHQTLGSHRVRPICAVVVVTYLAVFAGTTHAADVPAPAGVEQASPELCALLDDEDKRKQMDGLLLRLLIQCGREHELGLVRQEPNLPPLASEAGGADVPVSDPSGDSGSSHTQSETSMTLNEVTGTVCAGYNDSYHYYAAGEGFTGFSRSVDGGATFTDQGALSSDSLGDPSIVWRKADGHFYFAALHSSGLGLWKSVDDCQSFSFVGTISTGSDDKELIAVDNNETSPHYGRLYCVWTDLVASQAIKSSYSSDAGVTWSSEFDLSDPGDDSQGSWPFVAPNGDVYVGWVHGWISGPVSIEVARSTDGGVSYTRLASPLTDATIARDAAATGNCGRSALNGNIRYLPSPQVVVGPDDVLHVVYSYDPDGAGTGDTIDVFYRRSTDNGATWEAEMRLNDDATTTDQFFPTLSIGSNNIVSATWYDRRDDPSNLLFKYYQRFSFDGGVTWQPSEAVSDAASPVYLDPGTAACYHGDYDTHIQTESHALPQWSDDRNLQGGHNDPDVWVDRVPVSNDYLLLPDTSAVSVCAPDDAVYPINVPQFSGFTEPVTLTTSTLPSGLVAGFVPNPVSPPGATVLTLSGTAAVAVGSYDIDVTGTSTPSNVVHDTAVSLTVFDAIPGAVDLSAPVDGAEDVSVRPSFEWRAVSQAATFTIEVDDDPGFASPELSASDIAETEFTPDADLPSSTVLYWRVRAHNTCGNGGWSATSSFLTEALPGDCNLGDSSLSHFTDDFEVAGPGWTHEGTGDTWTRSDNRANSGSWSFYAEDVSGVSDQRLVSPPIILPASQGQSKLTLQFWTWQEMEALSATECWDGGILEISTDDGASWDPLPNPVMLTDPYDGPINSTASNPLSGLDAWCGDPQDWLKSVVDVDDYAGETVRFRFRLGTDVFVSREGWYIDDVEIRSCVDSEIFTDGFESGDTTAWSNTVP